MRPGLRATCTVPIGSRKSYDARVSRTSTVRPYANTERLIARLLLLSFALFTSTACASAPRAPAWLDPSLRTQRAHLQPFIDDLRKCGEEVRWTKLRSDAYTETYVLFACDQIVKLECGEQCGGPWSCNLPMSCGECTFDRG